MGDRWTVKRDLDWLNVEDYEGKLRFQVGFDVESRYLDPIHADIASLVDCFNACLIGNFAVAEAIAKSANGRKAAEDQ